MRVSILALVAPLASAAIIERQSSPTQIFKGSGALENIAVRSNGQLLVTRFDANEVWTVDPATKIGSKLASFSGVTSMSGITEVTPDVFAVVGGKYSGGRNTAGSYGIFKIDLTGSTPATSTIKMIPESGMMNGLTTLDNDTVLIGEGKGSVYSMKISTGEYSIAITDATMSPPTSAPIPLGIDGLRYHNGSIYYTNIFKNSFYKLAVDPSTGKASGKPMTIWTNQGGDDLAFGADGSPYVALTSGHIAKVDPSGKATSVASVSGCTAANFGRGASDRNTLYVVTSGGVVSAVPNLS